ncbi:hypothetical protein KFE94_06925 [bacterium SCSIO 12643]|nr:hypothetical protein KFE94_06925 [bacterium SCSIO 12643]
MRKILLTIITACAISYTIQAQEETEELQNLLSLSFGYSYVSEGAEPEGTEVTGVYVPSIGIDYFRKISPRWEIGTMIDLELSDYLIIKKDLNRSKALVMTAIASYNPFSNVNVFAGGGIEIEKHKNLGVMRFGAEYAFVFSNDWILAPGAFYDVKEGYNTWSIAVAFGREF